MTTGDDVTILPDDVTILSGEVWLVLDNRTAVHVEPGDGVVQSGMQHAWRNRHPEPGVFVGMVVGAKRQGERAEQAETSSSVYFLSGMISRNAGRVVWGNRGSIFCTRFPCCNRD